VRYHGGAATVASDILDRWQREGRIVAVCPEVAGGLGTPRPPAEIQQGTGLHVLRGEAAVMAKTGADVTAQFTAGADHAVRVAAENGVRVAVLKSNSPSCGTGAIYDGSFSGAKIAGDGVAAAALRRAGIQVFDEHHIAEAAAALLAQED
jgi:uncharacterized protein YbbK (DUF523 family)